MSTRQYTPFRNYVLAARFCLFLALLLTATSVYAGGLGAPASQGCLDNVSVAPLDSGTNITCVSGAQIGVAELLAKGVSSAVDLWGTVQADTEVCFAGQGELFFLNANTFQDKRPLSLMSAYSQDDMTCASIVGAGIVALVPAPAPVAMAIVEDDSPTSLNCAVSVSVAPASSGTNITCVSGAQIGVAEVLAKGVSSAVDLWGTVQADTEVCFAGEGHLFFLNANTFQDKRPLSPLSAYSQDGMTCASIPGAGIVALTIAS